jgi:hypothetical protein
MATLISRDNCRKVAFEYFLAAAEVDDREKQKALRRAGDCPLCSYGLTSGSEPIPDIQLG